MTEPYISSDKSLPELTFKAVLLALILATILAASNAYVGLKIGWLVSPSIPAAIIAMVLFRFAKQSNILENNIVQTGASASACIAAGVVFVIPALLLVNYWPKVDIWSTVYICLVGGSLGVLFSVPLRRALLNHPELKFPEGKAIAEVLKANESSGSLKELFLGSIVGAIVQFCQQGFQILASTYQLWISTGRTVVGFGMGFDITMFGAGYIIGFGVCFSTILGAVVGWLLGVPVVAHFYGGIPNTNLTDFVMALWSGKLRYVGIGMMLAGGLWSLIACIRPIIDSLKLSYSATKSSIVSGTVVPRSEKDLPIKFVLVGIVLLLIALAFYLMHELTIMQLGLSHTAKTAFFIFTMLYIVFAGFVFSAITAYFSGLVGFSASPVSAINLAILITIALLLNGLLVIGHAHHDVTNVVVHAAAISILITAIIACAASMSNGTIQDLKTGEILGATPWKLQLILILGVAVSAMIVPPVVELLFNAYGIGNVFPHAGMNAAQVLAAPQASLIAAVAQGVFFHNLPFHLIGIGVVIGIFMILLNEYLKPRGKYISVVAFAVGAYLPMSVTVPIFLGGLVSLFVSLKHKKEERKSKEFSALAKAKEQSVMLIACGLVAGGSIMGLLVAIPFAIKGNTNVLSLVQPSFTPYATILSLIVTALVFVWMYRTGAKK